MRNRSVRFWYGAFLLWVVGAGTAHGESLILKRAGSNRNTFNNGELVSTLSGGVTFRYGEVTMKSDRARWWHKQGRVKGFGDVRVFQEEQELTCDRIEFFRDRKLVTAHGNVDFVDRKEGMRLSGERARYHLDTKKCYLDGSPKVVRFDTASVETLTIVGNQMSYDDSVGVTSAHENVIITKGALRTVCEDAYYFNDSGLTKLRTNPKINYESHRLLGDSVNLYFRQDTLDGAEVVGNATGKYLEEGEKDTTNTNVWGDSLYMSVSDKGYLDSVWVHGKVKSTYSKIQDTLNPNQVTGKQMVLSFGEDSKVNDATVIGNATSVYFIEEEADTARNEASGDTLSVWFHEGKAVKLRLTGKARGVYYP